MPAASSSIWIWDIDSISYDITLYVKWLKRCKKLINELERSSTENYANN